MAKDLFTECAHELAHSPDLVSRLLADHQPNDAGWCRAHSAHPERHPCSIRTLAEIAAGAVVGVPGAEQAAERR